MLEMRCPRSTEEQLLETLTLRRDPLYLSRIDDIYDTVITHSHSNRTHLGSTQNPLRRICKLVKKYNMFVIHKVSDEFVLPPEESNKIEKHLVHRVFEKYLFKFCDLGYCVSILNVDFVRNVIMRETSDVMMEVIIELMFIELNDGSYVQGIVKSMDQSGIQLEVCGVIVGSIVESKLHEGTLFNQQKSKWVYPVSEQTGYLWQIGDKTRAKVVTVQRGKTEQPNTAHLMLRADEAGLGPTKWWV